MVVSAGWWTSCFWGGGIYLLWSGHGSCRRRGGRSTGSQAAWRVMLAGPGTCRKPMVAHDSSARMRGQRILGHAGDCCKLANSKNNVAQLDMAEAAKQ